MVGSYYIFSPSNGCVLSASRSALIVNQRPLPDPFCVWDILALGGTSLFLLRHHATQMFAYLGNGDGQIITLANFAACTSAFHMRIDDVGGGYCALNTQDGGLVFDVAGNGGAGTPVILYGWNGNNSANQIWQLVPHEVYDDR